MGSTHPRGQRVGGGFPLPSARGRFSAGGRGWVPAYARTTGGGWVPASVFAGAGLSVQGGWGWVPAYARLSAGEGGWVPAYARTTGGRGWVPASARTREGGRGFPLPSLRGRVLRGGTGMGPRIREDNGVGGMGGWGWVPAPAFAGAGSRREDNGWGLGQGDGRFANRPYGRRILSGTGFTPIPRLHEGRL